MTGRIGIGTRGLAALALAIWAAAAAPAGATADGPDALRVTGLAAGETLALRAGPGKEHAALAGLGAEARGLIAFGCTGGLDFAAWQQASEAERAEAAARRWCLVGQGRRLGWARGMHLGEDGGGPTAWTGGGRLSDLAGSEWRFRDFGTEPAPGEAWIAFGGDGAVSGHSGCNRFAGQYEAPPGRLSLGPVAMTRMACPEPAMRLEDRVSEALGAVERVAATHLVLALMDGEGRILATLERRDAD